jgi:hypothetical protein
LGYFHRIIPISFINILKALNALTQKERYKDREIVISEDEDRTQLSIDGKDIHHIARGGRYWSHHIPYVDHPSLTALAKSIIDRTTDSRDQ